MKYFGLLGPHCSKLVESVSKQSFVYKNPSSDSGVKNEDATEVF
jgi:hypothetical protein